MEENSNEENHKEESFIPNAHTSKKSDKVGALTKKMRENPYIVSTVVLGVIVLIFVNQRKLIFFTIGQNVI